MSPRNKSHQSEKTVLVLVRHGATPTTGKVLPGRAKGLHLSDKGVEEAKIAGEALAAFLENLSNRFSLGAIYSSPMERARETALIVTKAISAGRSEAVKPVIDRNLIECDFGDWTGQSLASLAKLEQWKQIYVNPGNFRFPSGESFMELQSRMIDALRKYRLEHRGSIVIALSHADPIKAALCDAMGTHISSIHKITVGTACISIISYLDEMPNVNCINVTGNLSAAERTL